MKQITSFLLLLTALVFSTQKMKAESKIYATLSSDELTLTLYYGEQSNPADVTDWSVFKSTVTTIVLDKTMQDARPTSTKQWFDGFSKVTSFVNLTYLNTEEVTDMSAMFRDCSSLEILNLSGFHEGNVTNTENMFYNCSSLTTIYCGGYYWYTIESTSNMFYGCLSLVGGYGTTYDSNHVDGSYARQDNAFVHGYFTEGVSPYPELYATISADGKTLTIYYDGFKGICKNLCSFWDGQHGADINVTWSSDEAHDAVTTVNLNESVKEARPTTIHGWFYRFGNLTEIQNFSYLNTEEATDISSMFTYCYSLTSIDLSNFNTENVKNMGGMFSDCISITSLDISNFNVGKVTNMSGMFSNCTALQTIYCNGDWSYKESETYAEGMFENCTSLVGGNNTIYDPNHTNITYARADEEGNPGYFTKIKPAQQNFEMTPAIGTLLWNEEGEHWQVTVLDDAEKPNVMFQFVQLGSMNDIPFEVTLSNSTDDNNYFEVYSPVAFSSIVKDANISIITEGTGILSQQVGSETLYYVNVKLVGSMNDADGNTLIVNVSDDYFPLYISGIVIPTAIESAQPSVICDRKIFRNGHIYILREGKVYTATGLEVK